MRLPASLGLVLALVAASTPAPADAAERNVQLVFPGCDTLPPPDPLASEMPWVDPRLRGGRMLDAVGTSRYGEPINVIISGHSDPGVLSDRGFRLYAESIGFATECLGLHIGTVHRADLGDGAGWRGEQLLARQTFQTYFPLWGTTCWESFAGGNHFRAWRQNGTAARTGAWFLAVSREKRASESHMIVADGYNVGRDLLVARALAGSKAWGAQVEWVQGLLEPGSDGVNHRIPQDGLVAVLTVRALAQPETWRSLWSLLRFLLPFLPI